VPTHLSNSTEEPKEEHYRRRDAHKKDLHNAETTMV